MTAKAISHFQADHILTRFVFPPLDRYLLENEKFRLYYTAAGDEAHNFIVVVEDNFGNSFELEFELNNRNAEGESQTVMYAANFKPMPR